MTDHAETLVQALATGVLILVVAIGAGFIVSAFRDWIKNLRTRKSEGTSKKMAE